MIAKRPFEHNPILNKPIYNQKYYLDLYEKTKTIRYYDVEGL